MPPVAAAEEEQHHAALMEDTLAFQQRERERNFTSFPAT